MHAVAVAPGGELRDVETIVGSVAVELGRSHAEIRQRIALAGADPVVLGVHRDAEAAHAIARLLCNHGLRAIAVAVLEPFAGLIVARSFALSPDALCVEGREHDGVELAFADVHAIVVGRRVEASAPAREAPQAGLARRVSRRLDPLVVEPKIHEPPGRPEGIVHLFGADRATALREHELLYQSLGPELQPSRGANFRRLVDRLRERCTHAVWDERLLRPAVQAHVLGPMTSIDTHLALASTLVAAAVRRVAADPYR